MSEDQDQAEFEAFKQWNPLRQALSQKYNSLQAWKALNKDGKITAKELGIQSLECDKIFAFIKKDSIDGEMFEDMWHTWDWKYQDLGHKFRLTDEKVIIHRMLESPSQMTSPRSPNESEQKQDRLDEITSKLEKRMTIAHENKDKHQIQGNIEIFQNLKKEHQKLLTELAISKFEKIEKSEADALSQPKQVQTKSTYLNSTPQHQQRSITFLDKSTPVREEFINPKKIKLVLSTPGGSSIQNVGSVCLSLQSKRRDELVKPSKLKESIDGYMDTKFDGSGKFSSLSPSREANKHGFDNILNKWTNKKRQSQISHDFNFSRPAPSEYTAMHHKVKSIQQHSQNIIRDKINLFHPPKGGRLHTKSQVDQFTPQKQ